ncbi:hypothetical protein J6590_082735 [Homalodisca vitripennis]|nr:hypothetical protein J6590_082735 [Homalodisca vitripennis]
MIVSWSEGRLPVASICEAWSYRTVKVTLSTRPDIAKVTLYVNMFLVVQNLKRLFSTGVRSVHGQKWTVRNADKNYESCSLSGNLTEQRPTSVPGTVTRDSDNRRDTTLQRLMLPLVTFTKKEHDSSFTDFGICSYFRFKTFKHQIRSHLEKRF